MDIKTAIPDTKEVQEAPNPIPPQTQGLLVPLPTTENVQKLEEMGCIKTTYKGEEITLGANSHSVIGVLIGGLTLMLTAEVSLFSVFKSGEKGCEKGKVLAGVAITFAVICLLFSLFTYWQLQQIECMFSDLQRRQRLLSYFMAGERENMQSVPADDHRENTNLHIVNELCDSISEPLRLQKLLCFYKVLVCILATVATIMNMLMGYKSYGMKCGQIDQ